MELPKVCATPIPCRINTDSVKSRPRNIFGWPEGAEITLSVRKLPEQFWKPSAAFSLQTRDFAAVGFFRDLWFFGIFRHTPFLFFGWPAREENLKTFWFCTASERFATR